MELPYIFRKDLLRGKVAFVTGGASGIGLGISERLAMAGCDVVMASRRVDLCEKEASEVAAKHGVRTLGMGMNVREPESVAKAFHDAHAAFGRIDILVNNAAGNFYYPSHMLSDNQWKAVLEIDLYGTFHCCRAIYPYMKENGGLIVGITMTLHHTGWVGMLPACAAKSGIDALTRTLAVEWGRHGIRVNAISPGPIVTEGVKKAFEKGSNFKGDYARIPLGRAGEVEEVGDLVVYMASPSATWMTGEIINLDGGERLSPKRAGVDPVELEQKVLREMGERMQGAGS